MKKLLLSLFVPVFFGSAAIAEVDPVSISASEMEAWTGEKVALIVELRARGSFSGSASFDLPEIPGTLLVKAGNPVVGSKEIEGESWFIQTHEFALFSQKTGTLEIPPFPVRFQAREDFTGPALDVVAATEAVSVEIKRPPGSEGVPFLVTTAEYTVEETWDPAPGENAVVGDVFRRTIVQHAVDLTGMALLPTPDSAPDGVRVYQPQVETRDDTDRGTFKGERRETLTYLLQEAGAITLPELTYTWWNPQAEKLESKSLPSVTLQVAPAPVSAVSDGVNSRRWIVLLIAIALAGLVFFQRSRLSSLAQKVWRALDPPEQVAARHLRRACKRDDPAAACKAWNQWSILACYEFGSDSKLQASVFELQNVLFGSGEKEAWNGVALRREFQKERAALNRAKSHPSTNSLPSLNFPNKLTAN